MNSLRILTLTGVAMAAFLVAACSNSPGSAVAADQAAAPTAGAAATPPHTLTACELVTAPEMSTLLGGRVTAQPNGQSACVYSPAAGVSPYAELKIEWGAGEAGMMGAGLAMQHEPGLADPLAGLGDQAVDVGPMIMIRHGDDLITIVLSGVEDPIEHAKLVYKAAAARM